MDPTTAITGIETAIGNYGFPIVVCAVLFWYMVKQDERHRDEMNAFAQAINNNTLVLNRILDKLEVK